MVQSLALGSRVDTSMSVLFSRPKISVMQHQLAYFNKCMCVVTAGSAASPG